MRSHSTIARRNVYTAVTTAHCREVCLLIICSTMLLRQLLGHAQKEHETSHGSMSKTSWLVEGADGTTIQLDGRKYASSDEGAPMMCNLLCASMSRHSHVTYCRTPKGAPCVGGGEKEHISKRMSPNPDKPKDWITHDLFWRRSGAQSSYNAIYKGRSPTTLRFQR